MLFTVLIIPLALITGLIYLLIKKRYRGLWIALIMCLATLLVGVWAIFQSRSSTAGIGLLFLPFYGLFAGVMGWLSSNLRATNHKSLHLLGWCFFTAALGAPVLLGYQGISTTSLNASRDAKQAQNLAEIARNKVLIGEVLGQHKGHESETIEAMIREHPDDRNFLLPALENPFVSAATLDRLAQSNDLGIALSAIRHPNCRSETLARIYRNHAYPDYFFQALAAHPNTPKEILGELYRRPVTIMGLDRSFARNPSTPKEILADIVKSTREIFVVQQFLQNPKLECSMISPLEEALKRSERPDDSFSASRIRELKSGQCPGSGL
ncbi:MAG: hypothetical protein WCL27_12790 [Betaproteobacteria bacterium]